MPFYFINVLTTSLLYISILLPLCLVLKPAQLCVVLCGTVESVPSTHVSSVLWMSSTVSCTWGRGGTEMLANSPLTTVP